MVLKHALPVLTFLLMLVPSGARGQDFLRDTVPWKWIDPLVPEDLPAIEAREFWTPLETARAQAFAGRYKLALATLYKAKDAPGDPVEIALIKGMALAPLGRRDEALSALTDAKVVDDPRVQVMRANILTELGRTDESIALLKSHIDKHPDSLAGHYYLGQVYEQVGDIDAAKKQYEWFVAEPNGFLNKWQGLKEEAFKNAEEVTILGRALDRWATLTEANRGDPELHNAILNIFVRTYDVIDRGYWPAHIAAAEYFLTHDNSKDAVKELAAVEAANPNSIQAMKLMCGVALENFNFDGVDQVIAQIRSVDRTSLEADLLEVRNLLAQRLPIQAEALAAKIVERQPKNLEARGLLAAANALMLREDRMNQILADVEKLDPDNASAYLEVADQLGAMRQYPRSAAMYKVAIERAPWWTTARNGLGLLYTQWGEEDDARATLDAAHELDPFNLRTTNYLRLLDNLAKFQRKETAHFIVFYDAAADPVIPEYFSDYMESVYDEICAAFKHEPPVKTYIEVFPTHDAFSVRTTGSPWIGTVGASTGRVLALVSPRKGKNTMGTYNWAQVLRHEFTHTVTLSATENRIPHWMTEGLAVYEERVPLRWDWVPMLYRAVTKDELFTMENLTWGFVRPKRPMDRQLAYAQSFWICKYLEQTYGHDAILKMLDEYHAGKQQEEVFPKIIGRSLSQFNTEFFAWADQQVATWGYDEATSKKYADLRERGEELIKARQYVDAVATWEEIAKIRPVDALPHQRLAGLYLTKEINDRDKAVEHLIVLHQVELKDNRYAKRIARVYRDGGKPADGVRYALDAVYIDPYDLDAHTLLAELYEKTGNEEGLKREQRVIPVLKEWVEKNRK